MTLVCKQHFFTFFDKFTVSDLNGNPVYLVNSRFSFGHFLEISDMNGNILGVVREKVFRMLSEFDFYLGSSDVPVGTLKRRFTFLKPKYDLSCMGLEVYGDVFGYNYCIKNSFGQTVVTVSKKFLALTDSYQIDVADAFNPLLALMVVIAIDAEHCGQD